MPRYAKYPQASIGPIGESRFKDFVALLNQPATDSDFPAGKKLQASSKRVSSKPSSPNSVKEVKSVKQTPPPPKVSAEEIERRRAEYLRNEALRAEALKRKEADDIRQRWRRAIVKCGRELKCEEDSPNYSSGSIEQLTEGLTGQAKIKAHWRAVHKKMEARGWARG